MGLVGWIQLQEIENPSTMTPKGSSFAFAESKDDRPKCPLEKQHGTLQDQTIQTYPNHFKAGFAKRHDSRLRNHRNIRNHPFFAGPYQFSSILSVLRGRSMIDLLAFRFGIPATAPAC